MLRMLFCVMFCSTTLWAQNYFNDTQSIAAAAQSSFEQHLETTPDLLELVVKTDQEAQGFRASHHVFQIQLEMDPLVNGRLSLGFQYRLNNFLVLDVPVSFDHLVLGQGLGRLLGVYSSDIVDQWALMGGLGLKIRLSEWMLKSSLYIEPILQAGYYQQTASMGSEILTESIRIRPGLYMGFETVFDTGLVLGMKVGVEQPFDIRFRGNPLSYSANFSVVPMFNLGYAW